MTALRMLRPAELGDAHLRIMAELGKSASASVRIYVNSMFEIHAPSKFMNSMLFSKFVGTDNVTMLLRIERVSSYAQDEAACHSYSYNLVMTLAIISVSHLITQTCEAVALKTAVHILVLKW